MLVSTQHVLSRIVAKLDFGGGYDREFFSEMLGSKPVPERRTRRERPNPCFALGSTDARVPLISPRNSAGRLVAKVGGPCKGSWFIDFGGKL